MPDLLDSLASRGVECDPYVRSDTEKLARRETGSCTWDGTDLFLELYSGNSKDTREYLGAFRGLVSGYALIGTNYAIYTDDSTTAEVLTAKLGMELL